MRAIFRVHICSAHVYGYNLFDAAANDRADGDKMLMDVLKSMDMTGMLVLQDCTSPSDHFCASS